jgi:hypothetical protein
MTNEKEEILTFLCIIFPPSFDISKNNCRVGISLPFLLFLGDIYYLLPITYRNSHTCEVQSYLA